MEFPLDKDLNLRIPLKCWSSLEEGFTINSAILSPTNWISLSQGDTFEKIIVTTSLGFLFLLVWPTFVFFPVVRLSEPLPVYLYWEITNKNSVEWCLLRPRIKDIFGRISCLCLGFALCDFW